MSQMIEGNKFTNLGEMQEYMAKMVKVMELSMGYEWGSVKEFDDEFRHIQALYHYPWTYESHHLHTTRLQAKTQKPQA